MIRKSISDILAEKGGENMKKVLSVLLLAVLFVGMLTGCGLQVPRPEIKKGEFNVNITYEQDGEVKTLSGVYVCKYRGIEWTIAGNFYRKWKGTFKGEIKDEIVDICTTDDGGVVTLTFGFYPEYFMGDPEFAEHAPNVGLSLIYYGIREKNHTTYDAIYDDPEYIASYGVKLIDVEYDEPIENSFNQLF